MDSAVRTMLHNLKRLRPGDITEAAAVLVTAAEVEWGLRHRTLSETADRVGVVLFGDASPAPDEPEPTPPVLPPWAWRRARIAVTIMRCWPFGDTCLRRALVLGNRLAPLSPRLVIGVRPPGPDALLDAHAWLQIEGFDLDPRANEYLAFEAP